MNTLRRTKDWRVAIPVGIAAIAISYVVVLLLPFVVLLVLAWWLHIDLTNPDDPGLGWFGMLALALFGLLSAAVGVIAVSLDNHFECGGTLGGLGESASARLDEDCVGARQWRPVVAAVLIIVASVVATVRLARRRTINEFGLEQSSDDDAPASSVSAAAPLTLSALLAVDVAVVMALVTI